MMKKPYLLFAALSVLLAAPAAMAQQFPLLDMIAQNVLTKYQNATCEQLWEQKGKPKSPQERELMQLLETDPQARTYFINKVAGPVVNKMFQCGLLP